MNDYAEHVTRSNRRQDRGRDISFSLSVCTGLMLTSGECPMPEERVRELLAELAALHAGEIADYTEIIDTYFKTEKVIEENIS